MQRTYSCLTLGIALAMLSACSTTQSAQDTTVATSPSTTTTITTVLTTTTTAIVTTIYYVLFTLWVKIASSILFKEMTNLAFIDFVGCIAGFATIICALCLIHFF